MATKLKMSDAEYLALEDEEQEEIESELYRRCKIRDEVWIAEHIDTDNNTTFMYGGTNFKFHWQRMYHPSWPNEDSMTYLSAEITLLGGIRLDAKERDEVWNAFEAFLDNLYPMEDDVVLEEFEKRYVNAKMENDKRLERKPIELNW